MELRGLTNTICKVFGMLSGNERTGSWVGAGEGVPWQRPAGRFPPTSTGRELTDNAEISASWLGNESSCRVSRKQQQEPWAQFAHTWPRARLQGIRLSHRCSSRAAPADATGAPRCDQPESGLSRLRGGPQCSAHTGKKKPKANPATGSGLSCPCQLQRGMGRASMANCTGEREQRAGADVASVFGGGQTVDSENPVSVLTSLVSSCVILFMYPDLP